MAVLLTGTVWCVLGDEDNVGARHCPEKFEESWDLVVSLWGIYV